MCDEPDLRSAAFALDFQAYEHLLRLLSGGLPAGTGLKTEVGAWVLLLGGRQMPLPFRC